MLIDIPLLKLRYEILNVSIAELATELNVPASVLQAEATSSGWSQWWPNEVLPSPGAHGVSSYLVGDDDYDPSEPTLGACITSDEDADFFKEDESLLESGSTRYLRDMGLRLRVFNMAKDAYLSHKYATLESDLIAKAKAVIQCADSPQDLRHLSAVFKDLAANSIGNKSLSVGISTDGLPEVIIRDLRGRDEQ